MRIKSKTLYLILNIVKNLLALTIIIAVFCLILPGTAEAAIAVDAISTNTGTGSSITVSHTTSGENRLILVGISAMALNSDYESGIPRTISSVKYNDVDLTLVGSQQNVWGEKIWIYRLKAPDTETHNLVVTFTETSTGGTVVGVMTFTGVDQTTPLGTFVSAYDDDISTPATVNVSSASGELVFDAVFVYDAAITVGADQTQRWNLFSADHTRGGGSTEPGAASVTMSWSHAGNDTWCIGAVPIKPVSTPPTPTTPNLIRIFDNAIINTYSSSYECNVSVVSTDPDDDDIQYEIQWDTDPNLDNSPSSKSIGLYPSGDIAVTTIPAAAETIYFWRAHARTPMDWQYYKKITIDHTKVGVGVSEAPWYDTDWQCRNKITTDHTKVSGETWYNADWKYRKKITIDNTKVPNTDQTNFPVLINRTDTDWKVTGSGGHVDQSDGGDILFTSSDGTTKLDHEIEEYDSLTGELIAWVEVDNVSSSTDTDIYIYYGNATVANQWNVSGTWDEGGDNNYVAVWHLNETSGAYGGDGTTREFSNIYTDWTSWFEITNDPNAPGAWTWSDVQGLDIKVRGVDNEIEHNERCAKIEIRVTYTTGTVTYYFNGYDVGQAWTNDPGNMVDGDEGTEAITYWEGSTDETQLCNSNTCPGTDLGTITTVEIRAKIDVYGVGRLYLTPIFPTGGPGAIKDATSNNYDGTDNGPTLGVTGKMSKGFSFDGSDDYVDITIMNPQSYTEFTFSSWYKSTDMDVSDDEYIYNHHTNSTNEIMFGPTDDGAADNRLRLFMETDADGAEAYYSTTDVVDQEWHYLVAVRTATGRIRIYVDDAEELDDPGTRFGTTTLTFDGLGPWIGDEPGDTEQVHGILDEVRVSNIGRNANWILTEYNNQSSPNTFYSVSTEEQTLTNFPVLINRTDTDWRDTGNGGKVGQSDGGDILFTFSDGTTKLDHEIEEYDPSTGELIAWVEVPTVSASTNTDIYIYYGNATVPDQWNVMGTWDSDFKMVQHMADATSSTIEGSTSNGITGTKGSADNPDEVDGQIGKVQDFDYREEYISLDDDLVWTWTPVNQDRTFSNWVYFTSLPGVDEYGFDFIKTPQGSVNHYHYMYVNSGGTEMLAFIVYEPDWTIIGYFSCLWSPSTGTWYNITMVATSAGNCKIYIDGVSQSVTEVTWGDCGSQIDPDFIGIKGDGGNTYGTARMDEYRFSHTARSADWIVTSYNNQDSPSTFYSVGNIEEQGLTNFPVLINRTDADWKYTGNGGHVGQSDGGDIFFTSSDGTTKLDHEIEIYVPSAGSLIAWVEVDNVSSLTDTDIYIYYGNATVADQWNVSGTWDEGGDNNYEAVWHLNESSGNHLDATGNGNNSTAILVTQQGADIGKIDGADDFDGTDDYVNFPNFLDFSSTPFTIEIWFKATTIDQSDQNTFISKWHATSGQREFRFEIDGNGPGNDTVVFSTQDATTYHDLGGATALTVGNWYYAVVTINWAGDDAYLYLNGAVDDSEVGTWTWGMNYETSPVYIACRRGLDQWFDGIIDEVRISTTDRSANWIVTCYNNQDSPNTFYSVDVEEAAWSPWTSWSGIRSFTMDMELENEYPYWYQVAGPQFEQGTKNGVTVQGDSVVFSGTGAEVVFQRASGSTGLSHSIDIGSAGNDRLVVVIVGDESSLTSLTNVTVDGKDCTKAGEADNTNGNGNHQELWYILEATLGSSNGTVTVTCTGGDAEWATHVHVYYGVKQSTPYDFEVEEAITSGTTISVENVSSLDGSVVIFGAGMNTSWRSASSWTSPLTERTDGSDPNSASLATASDLESTGQTNKTYVCTWSGTVSYGTGIVAVWEPAESNEGTLISPPIVFADLFTESSNNRDDWDGVKWTKSSADDSIGVQVEYKNVGVWTLVPNVVIGEAQGLNSIGFFDMTSNFCTVDLTNIGDPVGTEYDTLRIKVLFKSYSAKSASVPALLMLALGNTSGSVTGISKIDKPMIFALYRNRPNPFTNRTEIRYQLPKRVKVELQVFDVIGRSVVTLVNKEQKSGYYSIQWRGMNKNKKLLPSGIYFLRMEAGDFKATQKMVRIR